MSTENSLPDLTGEIVTDIVRKSGEGDFSGAEQCLNVLAEVVITQAIDRNNEEAQAIFDKVERAWSMLATRESPDTGFHTVKDVEAELRAMTRVLGTLLQHPKTALEPEVALSSQENRDLFSTVKAARDGLSSFELKQKMLELRHMAFADVSYLHGRLRELERANLVTRQRIGRQTIVWATEAGKEYELAA
jgi:DNA-binding MarR family transcriptional regulator